MAEVNYCCPFIHFNGFARNGLSIHQAAAYWHPKTVKTANVAHVLMVLMTTRSVFLQYECVETVSPQALHSK